VACGGWSRRATLFGADAQSDRQPSLLDPLRDAARIRAFFVHPLWSRRGLGQALLDLSERAARAEGFRAMQLMATLPGQRLYAAHGYESAAPYAQPLTNELSIEFVPMHRRVA
jgi:GNAT superfamily N-acetyltransferase